MLNHQPMTLDITRFKWKSKEIKEFQNQVDQFKSFRNKPITQENFQEAFGICYLLCDKIPLAVTLIKVPYILRGRANEDESVYSKETEISYNSTNTHAIKLGRFNRPCEPVFYGSLPDEIDHLHFGAAASLECCKKLLDLENEDPYQYITFGKWFLKKPFYAINLCNDDKLLTMNPGLRASTLKHEQDIRDQFGDTSSEFIINFWKFLSSLAGKRQEIEQDHFLTTAFLCAIIKYRENVMKANTAGIIYPSTMTENEGINIVLTRASTDRFLVLKKVHMAKFVRRPNNPTAYDIYQCTDEVDVIDHTFQLTKKL